MNVNKGMSALSPGVLGLNNPDVGMCDMCGTDDGRRWRVTVVRAFSGELRRCIVWLCADCRRTELA